MLDAEGREVPGTRGGYRYFGRAKDLPGVRELFEQPGTLLLTICHQIHGNQLILSCFHAAIEEQPKSRAEMHRTVDADYYGYRDEDDGKLLAFEQELGDEREYMQTSRLQLPLAEKEGLKFVILLDLRQALQEDLERGLLKNLDDVPKDWDRSAKPIQHPAIPTHADMEAWLVRKRQRVGFFETSFPSSMNMRNI
jgi:pre-mRNA-splicing factor ISY1